MPLPETEAAAGSLHLLFDSHPNGPGADASPATLGTSERTTALRTTDRPRLRASAVGTEAPHGAAPAWKPPERRDSVTTMPEAHARHRPRRQHEHVRSPGAPLPARIPLTPQHSPEAWASYYKIL